MLFGMTTQYTLKILFYLQEHAESLVSSKILCEELNIPYKYLTKILTRLTKEGLIESVQGRYGGFQLVKAHHIRIEDIALVEKDELKECILGGGPCNERGKCRLHDSWREPKKAILEQLLRQEI